MDDQVRSIPVMQSVILIPLIGNILLPNDHLNILQKIFLNPTGIIINKSKIFGILEVGFPHSRQKNL